MAEALETRTHPERLTPLVPPTPFSAEVYARDPEAYLSVSEPARALAAKPAGPGVPRLQRLSPASFDLRQGATRTLRVATLPGQPVSFACYDGGRFRETTCPAITVKADENGIATATFEATAGSTRRVSITCASPVASGVLRFTAWIDQPATGPAGSAP